MSTSLATGLVHNVTLTSPMATLAVDYGTVESMVAVTLPEYPSEGMLRLSLANAPSSAFRTGILAAANASHLNISAIAFAAEMSIHGIDGSPPLVFSAVVPPTLALHRNESWRLAMRDGGGPVTLLSPSFQAIENGTLLKAHLPRLPSELTVLTVQEVSRSTVVTTTYRSGSVLSPGAESAGGSIWVGMITMFLLIAIVVVAIFYVHRRRDG